MKIIDFSQLIPGDILLTTSQAMVSKSVRFGTKSDISHAMLYVGSNSAIDSTSDGVHARNLQKIFYEDDCAVYALRPVTPLSLKKLQEVIEYARLATGTPYTIREAIKSIGSPQGTGSNKQFCSRLVARAYASAAIKLVDNPDFCTPQQLKDSPLLQLLPSPAIEISKEEMASILSRPNHAAGMIEVTNKFLDMILSFAPGVLDIAGALQFVYDNQSYDSQFYEALDKSEYLDFWRNERNDFYWRYDFEDMVRFASEMNLHDDITGYCKATLQDFKNGAFQHWEQNQIAWKENAHAAPLKSFKAMATLYENLVSGAQLRLSAANQWLASQANFGE